ncbi:MAG TPA: poly(A) polymerase [Desulfobacterales bacterium]|nr:poly(A) polymerase [Desulfobacterales bacterium]
MTTSETTAEAVDDNVPAPQIIPKGQHPITNNDIDADALMVLRRLRQAGFTAYLVGGGVRDIFLGKAPKDFDISTSARPAQVRKVFRNSRIIGRRFRLAQVFFNGGKIIEVATFRRRSEYEIAGDDVVLPANNSFGTPVEDAFRRDLTINALFYEIEGSTVIDFIGGVDDLNNRVVRLIGDPERRITRDPVRMMRVIRHAARAAFEVETETWQAILHNRDKLLLCPVSRIRDELLKDLCGGASRAWAGLAFDSGIFYTIFPFYRHTLIEHEKAEDNKNRLFAVLSVIDRLVKEGQKLPDGLLISLLLVSWVEAELDIKNIQTQKESYLLSRNIREKLAGMFGNLNIKRAMQDDVARSLATLPLLLKHDNGKDWPKWLQKKSYFKSGMHLFQIVKEVNGGPAAADLPFIAPSVAAAPKKTGRQPARRGPSYGGRGTAYAINTKGGVFGFRQH